MLDLVQTLAILKLLDQRKTKKENTKLSDFDGFLCVMGFLLILPILLYGFPLIYTLVYLPYKYYNAEQNTNNETLDNYTFFNIISSILLVTILITLLYTKVITINLTVNLLAASFYILFIPYVIKKHFFN
jgi:hypothetical protein